MKKSELLKMLLASGVTLHRHGNRHDIYYSPITGKTIPVPRHAKEIATGTADKILKDAGLK
ncbi:type II toxin-antitoxin system HicA family toxin [Akkermansia muciniphila]|uniref:type II toxin-antitoxin system HicA family toxin n=1 Tax=Akkermansia muciniphila TaxID=239935 RepID=UPI00122F0FFB|nr:type II toxin-antitoxin system HicA family toxin [Akkermansia muciniphila]